MRNVTLAINGKTVRCSAETSLLDACTAQGVDIPTLCHHPQLKPFGACRLCIVEDAKSGRIFASCVTPVSQDMEIQTHSERVVRHRRNIIRLIMAEHPESCLVCSKGNHCDLRKIAAQLGVGQTGLYPMHNYKGIEQANPFIIRDLTKCILCGKCIRADHELVCAGAIDYNHRGFDARPATLFEQPLEKSECTFCGTCVSLCPTGALTMKNVRYVGTPQKEHESICGFCAAGCAVSLGVTDGQVVEVTPSPRTDTVNGVTLCVRGHFAHDFLQSEHRLTSPMVKKDGEWAEISWTEAIEILSQKLLSVKKEHGPRTIGFMGSSKCTNEENYLFQKIARSLLETNNIDSGGHLFGLPLAAQLDQRLGGRFRARPLKGLEQAEAIFVIGANPGNSVPVAGYHIKRAAQNGTPLIVADPLPTDLNRFADLRLPVAPGRDLDMVNAISALLLEKKAYDATYTAENTTGFSFFRTGLSSISFERAAKTTGLKLEKLEQAAEMISGKKIAFVVGQGVLQQPKGQETLDAIVNLALITGSLDKGASGIYILHRENNQLGALDMGCAPDGLPGRSSLSDEKARKTWASAWGSKMSPDPGLSLVQMIREADKGNLKALYIMGENPARSLPDPGFVKAALEKVDFLAVQDILMTETAQLADMILPGAVFAEKAGSFTNMEGRVQSFKPALPLPGAARPDWEILAMLAHKLGMDARYSDVRDIQKEIAQLIPSYGEQYLTSPVSWVKDAIRDDQPMAFTTPVCWDGEDHRVGFDFTAITGSVRLHLGSGTRTGQSSRIIAWDGRASIEMSPTDAASLGIENGDAVRVVSQTGSMQGTAKLVFGFPEGLLRTPAGVAGHALAGLLDISRTPGAVYFGCKSFPVNVEKSNET
ncbi:NADH-quinone oxidoreductase subunit 3-like protein (Nqo3/NuoG) [Desulfatibacillum aliphaticivorans]|uniref:NADH-quinone oxidoreductase subunit 3-like protein (Nqo3/NuoG) n=1 Tax=Desulfatibacillum aliphaticivorans TaxID=218208 RepID=B8FFJ0_DESAL|nr:molybdopterin-dependent oxidoreductase [Desulfatibacillum aliphaticivorans]ACL04250.1 NADH-quinone oxidoreductase subunit 3-like protein (Nqo3/NuoG) [Desulfatibacillum aliphaticivorans]